MTLESAYYVSQVVATLCLLVSVLFLAKQIRDNSRMVSGSVNESAMSGYIALNTLLLEHRDVVEMARKQEDPEYAPSATEKFLVAALYRISANHIYKLHRLHLAGVLPDKEWKLICVSSREVFLGARAARRFVQRGEPYFEDLWPALGITADALENPQRGIGIHSE